MTGIPLYQLDSILYEKNGEQIDLKTYHRKHEDMLSSDSWIIDGFDLIELFNKRLEAADTLIYIILSVIS